jgi:hypothetical protein
MSTTNQDRRVYNNNTDKLSFIVYKIFLISKNRLGKSHRNAFSPVYFFWLTLCGYNQAGPFD